MEKKWGSIEIALVLLLLILVVLMFREKIIDVIEYIMKLS